MKIIIVQENLKNALVICSRAVSTSNTLAILGNILLKTQNGLLKMSSTNLEIGISQLVRCKVEEEGAACLPAKLLGEIVANLPQGPVTLETNNEGLVLSTGKYRTVLKTVPVDDFPVIPDSVPAQAFALSAQQFYSGLEGVLFAVSTNETQVELCGVYCAGSEKGLVLTGTDRYRLAESRLVVPTSTALPTFEVVVPARAASEVLKLVHGASGEVQVGLGDNQAVFSVGETTVTSRLVDAQYPEYQAIIPKEFAVSIKANRVDLMGALRAVAVFAKASSGVQVQYGDEGLTLSARSQEAGEGVVSVSAQVVGGEGIILFNHKYLLDILQFLTSEEVHVKLNNPTLPVVFENPDDKNYMYLVMPIKT